MANGSLEDKTTHADILGLDATSSWCSWGSLEGFVETKAAKVDMDFVSPCRKWGNKGDALCLVKLGNTLILCQQNEMYGHVGIQFLDRQSNKSELRVQSGRKHVCDSGQPNPRCNQCKIHVDVLHQVR